MVELPKEIGKCGVVAGIAGTVRPISIDKVESPGSETSPGA